LGADLSFNAILFLLSMGIGTDSDPNPSPGVSATYLVELNWAIRRTALALLILCRHVVLDLIRLSISALSDGVAPIYLVEMMVDRLELFPRGHVPGLND
jgi:hypothetical protein